MSTKAKIFLIIGIVISAIITCAGIAVIILSLFVSTTNINYYPSSNVNINTQTASFSDYSRYENGTESSDDVIQHENTEVFGYDLSSIELPEDFSFKIAWGIDYNSYYNSESGKMIKNIHENDIEKYTQFVLLSENELKLMYKYLYNDIDINQYPENYNPNQGNGSGVTTITLPMSSLNITVYANGVEKTVNLSNYSGSKNLNTPFMKSINSIVDFITSTDEWKAFPDNTVMYQ